MAPQTLLDWARVPRKVREPASSIATAREYWRASGSPTATVMQTEKATASATALVT
jgi:hypothetical protein